MSDRYYVCRVLGDGSQDDPFRNAIQDVLDPSTGEQAFVTRDVIDTPGGVLAAGYCMVVARGDKHGLLANNPDVDELFEPGLKGVKVSSLHLPSKNAAAAALVARGVDMSGFDNDSALRDWVDKVIKDQNPALGVDDLDFKD